MRTRSPRWQPRRRLLAGHVPCGLRAWLFEPGSLTRRLRERCPGQFSLTLVSSAPARPLADERWALRLARGQQALVRQVYLHCRHQPVVFARSVVPVMTLRRANRRLARLGSRPLADVLFQPSATARGPLELAAVRPGDPLYDIAVAGHEAPPLELWARRSLFYPAGAPLLVTEVFFPALAGLT